MSDEPELPPGVRERFETLDETTLSTRQAQCVAFAEHGFSAGETAPYLGIKRGTVTEYRRRAKNELLKSQRLVTELNGTDIFPRSDVPALPLQKEDSAGGTATQPDIAELFQTLDRITTALDQLEEYNETIQLTTELVDSLLQEAQRDLEDELHARQWDNSNTPGQ
jgi:DNA-directed RNA polymerase specialized sigma24 family protein